MKKLFAILFTLICIGAPAFADISGGGSTNITIITTTDASTILSHSNMSNLAYGVSGHTGFAGTGANNTFSGTNVLNGTTSLGTTDAGSLLTVKGTIETKGVGGVKFPDGTIQITKATVTSVAGGAGLTGAVTTNGLISVDALGVSTAMLANSSVTTGKIADLTILNADVSSSAAIAITKIALTANCIPYSDLNITGEVVGADLAPAINISTTGYCTADSFKGAWSGSTVATTKGGTGLTSYATGDVIYASNANTLSKLTVGAEGQIIKVVSGVPAWAAAGGGTVTNVRASTGLLGGVITNTGILTVDASYINLFTTSAEAIDQAYTDAKLLTAEAYSDRMDAYTLATAEAYSRAQDSYNLATAEAYTDTATVAKAYTNLKLLTAEAYTDAKFTSGSTEVISIYTTMEGWSTLRFNNGLYIGH